jgi:ATP/maltotriose-dependent transcriptional regulator MalT
VGTDILPFNLTGSLFSQIFEHAISRSNRAVIDRSVRMANREKQVMALISDGDTNKEIAQKLNFSLFTVKSHVHNILEKLALITRFQIVKQSFRLNSDPNK